MAELFNRATKLRWRRRFRRSRRQVEDLSVQAEEQLEQHFFKRLSRFAEVRRFVVSWVVLMILLIGGVVYQFTALSRYYETLKPVPGGIYTEGVVGSFTNANPIYATGAVDGAVSRLLFASLLKYDQKNNLVGDLAQSWKVDSRETTYTVTLKPHLKWHDGTPITAQDVAFTYQTIQNPDAKSPLYGSWQGVKVAAVDARTVTFTLPNSLVSFPSSLTNGIVPKHKLNDVPASQLRSVRFNTVDPVGSGPFVWEAIEVTGDTPETRQEQIAFMPNNTYHAGRPQLQQFKLRTFLDEKALIASFQRKELSAMSGLSKVPDSLQKESSIYEYSLSLTGAVAVFFKTTQPVLSDVKVRQALVQSVDQGAILKGLGYPVIPVKEPFLRMHFPYNKSSTQLPYNVTQANKLLDEAGWKFGTDGYRYKNNKQLTFQLYSQSTAEYTYLTKELQSYWSKVGVNAAVLLQSDDEIKESVSRHTYDALLYGISIGTDPDIFAYWHSSQGEALAVSRSNFSEYKSTTADKALEGGRTRSDNSLRSVKYKPFLDAWRTDAPALMLYQPRFLYITNVDIEGFDQTIINQPTDRFATVEHWMIRRSLVPN